MEELLFSVEGPALKFAAASHFQPVSISANFSKYIAIYIYTIQRVDKLPSNKRPLTVK